MPESDVAAELCPSDNKDLIYKNIQHSVATSTWKNYMSAWLLWSTFLSSLHFNLSEYSESLVLIFLHCLMEKIHSRSHISKILEYFFFLHLYNLPPCQSFFSVKQALKGCKRVSVNNDDRCPITPALLASLCRATYLVCSSRFEAIISLFCGI